MKEEKINCIDGSEWSSEKVLEQVRNYNGVVIRSRMKIDVKFLDKAVNLQFIARAGAGMESIDVNEAIKRNVVCLNAPEGNRDAVAEHVIGMILCLAKRILIADNEVRANVWKREANRGFELSGKTLGIIGFGNTGSVLAKKISGFEMAILAYDKYIQIDSKKFPFVVQTNLTEVLQQADVISLHVPISKETCGMVNDEFFNSCRKPVWIINTSRGKVVKTAALVAALKSGKIRGACLDVFDFEKFSFEQTSSGSNPDFEYLQKCENVILTPHIAGLTKESDLKIASVLAEKITRFIKNQ